jgi:hypothetical protein
MCLKITLFRASAGRKIAKQTILTSAQRSVYHKCPVLTGNYIPFLTKDFLLCGVINYFPGRLQYGITVGIVKNLCYVEVE